MTTAEKAARKQLREARKKRQTERLETVTGKVDRRQANVDTLRAQVAVLAEEVKPLPVRQAANPGGDLETDRGKPSYVLSARMHRRHNTTGVNTGEGVREKILDLYTKTGGNEFARQHGVQIPRTLGKWPTPDDIEWDRLPERFVVKSIRGGGGMNVFPLERDGDRFLDRLTNEPTTREAVTESLWKKHQPRSRYIAEEFLVARKDNGGDSPPDIKVFCFYGVPVYIEIRVGDQSRATGVEQQVRTFDADGNELFNVRALILASGDIAAPDDFGEVYKAASTISGGIRRPLERLDFYDTDHGIVFGEVTQNPGRPPALIPEWDVRMGEEYEAAYARLLTDVVSEGALHLEYGDKA